MKHALRKYISSCGSALFMVVSTMAALILLVTAMYLSVISQRSVQLTVFNQDQAYVSATSISDMITAYIMDSKKCDPDLSKKFTAGADGLEKFESISTNGNGFASFTGVSSDLADPALGAYDVTITRLEDDKSNGKVIRVYDIAVTVSNVDMVETTHAQISIPESEPAKMPAIDQFFTATGYLPNDVIIDSWVGSNSSIFADAEYTDITDSVLSGTPTGAAKGVAGGTVANVVYNDDIISAGSVHIDVGTFGSKTKSMSWVVGNKLIMEPPLYSAELGISDTDRGQICVGEQLIMRNGFSIEDCTDVYVQKDAYIDGSVSGTLYIGGDAEIQNGSFANDVYIFGDAKIVGKSMYAPSFGGNLYVFGNLEINGYLYVGKSLYVGGNLVVNQSEAKNPSFVNIADNIYMLSDTGSVTADNISCKKIYLKDGSFNQIYNSYKDQWSNLADKVVRKNTLTGDALVQYNDTLALVDVKKSNADTILAEKKAYMNKEIGGSLYPKWEVTSDGFVNNKENIRFNPMLGVYTHFITEDCTIESIGIDNPDNSRYTIVIDTGNNPTSVRKIRIQANCEEVLGSAYKDTFQWLPGASKNAYQINVVTVGQGTCVIDVPEGVTYQATDSEYIGSLDWAVLNGMYVDSEKGNLTGFNSYGWSDLVTDSRGFIHSGCTSCSYFATTIDNQEVYTCLYHDGTFTEADFTEYDEGNRACLCEGRVDNTIVKNYINSSSDVKARFEAVEDLIQTGVPGYNYEDDYPNVDFFVVSCDESADIQLGVMKYGDIDFGGGQDGYLMGNKFFGYVYAPYMTFVSIGAGGNDVKAVGGLVVSDYAISGSYDYYFVQSTRSIENIVQPTEYADPNGSRDWRIYGV